VTALRQLSPIFVFMADVCIKYPALNPGLNEIAGDARTALRKQPAMARRPALYRAGKDLVGSFTPKSERIVPRGLRMLCSIKQMLYTSARLGQYCCRVIL